MKFKLLLDELNELDFELDEPAIVYTIWQQY